MNGFECQRFILFDSLINLENLLVPQANAPSTCLSNTGTHRESLRQDFLIWCIFHFWHQKYGIMSLNIWSVPASILEEINWSYLESGTPHSINKWILIQAFVRFPRSSFEPTMIWSMGIIWTFMLDDLVWSNQYQVCRLYPTSNRTNKESLSYSNFSREMTRFNGWSRFHFKILKSLKNGGESLKRVPMA